MDDNTRSGWVSHSPTYCYEPKEDITTYELARITPLLVIYGVFHHGVYITLPENIQRHFRKSEETK